MKFGATFPQREIGNDPAVIRRYAEVTSDAGLSYLLAYDHVLGADTTNRPGWSGSYQLEDAFHEIFVLFGYLAACAPGLELVTGVVILPQRQAALVAKQASAVDVLTGGKLRLGVGIGWNAVEYEALGESFTTRGRRLEEQIALMRRLWTDEVVTFRGTEHTVTEAGLNPMPVQRPIPVWIGATADVAVARAARIADGWFPQGRADALAEKIAGFHRQVEEAGRRPEDVGVDARMSLKSVPEAEWPAEIEAWRALGATHLAVESMGMDLTPAEHIGVVERFAEVVARYGV